MYFKFHDQIQPQEVKLGKWDYMPFFVQWVWLSFQEMESPEKFDLTFCLLNAITAYLESGWAVSFLLQELVIKFTDNATLANSICVSLLILLTNATDVNGLRLCWVCCPHFPFCVSEAVATWTAPLLLLRLAVVEMSTLVGQQCNILFEETEDTSYIVWCLWWGYPTYGRIW